MSKGVSVAPRLGSAEARAITMKEVQMTTVITAEATPMVLEERRMLWIIRGPTGARPRAAPRHRTALHGRLKAMAHRPALPRRLAPWALAWACAGAMAQAAAPMVQGSGALPPAFTQALARAGVPPQAVGVMVTALPPPGGAATRPEVRLSHRADATMNPASVMKLVTTYAALDLLGPDFTWSNRVYVDGPVSDGVLDGNLILRGSGDPKLVLERLDALLRQVIAQGVREVRGDIVLDRAVFDVPERDPGAFDDEPLPGPAADRRRRPAAPRRGCRRPRSAARCARAPGPARGRA